MTNDGTVLSKIPGTLGGNKKLKIYGKLDCKCALNWIKKGYYIDDLMNTIDLARKRWYIYSIKKILLQNILKF